MAPLRTTVVMKTDISGSTRRFRELLAADLQALLGEHRLFLARHAAEYGGRILKPAGDGYWLEFPSVTGAAQAAIAMQEALRLTQLNRGDNRLAIRIVIALGDMAVHDDDFIGEAFALATRIEAVTPPDAIYLTAAARLALTSAAEIQTAFVETFALKGFAEPVPVYRIEQRHRTRVFADVYILFSDLNGFGSIMDRRTDHNGRAHPRRARCGDLWDGAGIRRYGPLQCRRFLLHDIRRGGAGHRGRGALEPKLGCNPA